MKYVANVPLSFKQHLVYRADFFAGLLGQVLRITIYAYLWRAVGTTGDVSPAQLTTYSLLAFILARGLDSSASLYLGDAIKDGSIMLHLLRPVNLQMTMLFRSIGENLFALLFNGLPLFVVCWMLFPIRAPASLTAAGLCVISIVVAALIGGAFSYLIGMTSFWTYNAWGISIFKQVLINAFSGALVPLVLLPAWLGEIVHWLPFASMVNQPILIYLGLVDTQNAIVGLFVQCGWAVGLFLIGRVVSGIAVSNLVVQGG